jgi:hypothetical protein
MSQTAPLLLPLLPLHISECPSLSVLILLFLVTALLTAAPDMSLIGVELLLTLGKRTADESRTEGGTRRRGTEEHRTGRNKERVEISKSQSIDSSSSASPFSSLVLFLPSTKIGCAVVVPAT